ncbi:MAG: flagellar basal body-associated FliL family protein [Sphingomonadaceae bacterium]|nr:flagellar basal body-associated FliL family protein [Sphingomonadaceae bacterium]
MTDKTETAAPPKKGKGLVVKLLVGLGLVSAGGGGAFALVQSGMLDQVRGGAKDDNQPRLVRKGEDDPYAPASEGKGGEAAADVDGEGGSEYRTSYYNFTEDFTSNLKNSAALIQVSVACSTRRDGRVLMWLRKHELAIRSEILVVLADTPEDEAFSPEGKKRLQARLTETINRVLTEREGFGGVDAVHFKSFLVQ